ncbi:hypothetical protein MMC30_004222 [Trapelia coarctata]|nr:hypothetical protein [Trapelia coarctata]
MQSKHSPVIVPSDYTDSDLYSYSVYTAGLEEKDTHSLGQTISFPATDGSLEPFPLPIINKDGFTGHQLPLQSPIFGTTRTKTTTTRLRALTEPLQIFHDEMTTFVQAPGSPPELTSSKSSSHADTDGINSDLSHFEDIGLNDDHPALADDLYGHKRAKISRPPSFRGISTVMTGNKGNAPTGPGMRELVNGTTRPTYPSLQGQVRNAITHTIPQSLSLPNGPGSRRSNASQSTHSLVMTAMRNRSRSRSPSPRHAQTLPSSPNPPSRPSTSSGLRPEASPVIRKSTSRRGSWLPSRKTTKELEDEFRDSDDDLPDDTSLWNVPLSPALYRETSSAVSSANSSAGTSPERPSHFGPSLVPDQNAIRSIPVTSQPFPGTLSSIPTSPMPPMPQRGNSTGMIPDNISLSKGRAKSWTIALSELSEEAKSLTEALEAHAFEADHRPEDHLQGASSVRSSVSSIDKLKRAKTISVELPPLRKGDIMIDPLPVSKEKEKVLSRTRPSWLPPKDKKEERKHLKEYQRMMEMSLEAERKKAEKAASLQCALDDTKATLFRIWEEHVLPNWDQAVREPRTRELWWRGIAPCSRAEVWRRAIGNELALTESTYQKALQRAKVVEKEIRSQKSGDERKEMAWFDAIRRDVASTFPDLKMFQLGRPLHGALTDVLMAYSVYRSDVGYSHGTHLPSALLLITVPTPALAFILLANLLNRPLPLAFLTGDEAGTQKTYTLVLQLLATKFPTLHAHLFTTLNLPPEAILEPMIRSFFLRGSCTGTDVFDENINHQNSNGAISPLSPSLQTSAIPPVTGGLSLELASRVWDVMVFDGDAMVIRTCVAILGSLESGLYGDREDVLRVLGWGGGMGEKGMGLGGLGEDEFMVMVREVGKEGRREKEKR